MAKSTGSAANSRVRSTNSGSNSNSFMSNNRRSSGPMNEGENTNNEVNQRTPRPSKSFSPPTGMRLGNSQVSGETSYQTGVSQNASARKSAGNAAISRQQREKSPSYQTGVTPQTMARQLRANAANKRYVNMSVPKNIINAFIRNINSLEQNISREDSLKLKNSLKGNVKAKNFRKIQENFQKARTRAARLLRIKALAESARKKQEAAKAAAKNAKRAESAKRKAQAAENAKRAASAEAKREAATVSKVKPGVVSENNFEKKHSVTILKQILSNRGKETKLGRFKQPYIKALINMGLTKQELETATASKRPGTATGSKRPRTATGSKTPGTAAAPEQASKRLRTAAQGASAYMLKKQKLANEILGSSLITNNQKQNLTMKLQSGNVNQVQKNFNNLLKPQQNTPANYKMCKSLLSVYKTKIKNTVKLNDEKIIKQMMEFNIAYSANKKSLNNNTSSVKDIDLKQYFNVLLIVWMDGVHDGYVDKYFKDWYSEQIESGIFPSHEKTEIEKMATNISEYNSPIMSNVLNKLKVFAPEIIPGIISDEKLTVKEEVKAYTNDKLTVLCGPSKDINKVTLANRARATNFVKNYYFRNNAPERPRRPDKFIMKAGWEKTVKGFLLDHFKLNINNRIVNKQITLPNGNGILISIDQEYSSNQERPLTKLIDNEATTGLLTFGQALDPGSTMLPKLITSDLQGIVLTMENIEPKPKSIEEGNSKKSSNNNSSKKNLNAKGFIPNAKYYLNDFTFVLKQNGTKVFDFKLNVNNGGIPNLSLNDKKLIVNQSAGKAGKATDEAAKISKFFGDALQYLIFTNIGNRKFISENNVVRYPYLSSGDSMMLLGYTVFSEIMGVKPYMIIDFSESNLPIYYPVNLPQGAGFTNLIGLPNTSRGVNFKTRSNA